MNVLQQWRGNYLQAGGGAQLTFASVVHDRKKLGYPKSSFLVGFRPLIFHPLAYSPIKKETKRKYKE